MERMCSAVAKLPVIGDCGSSGRLNAPVFYKRDKAPQEVQFPEGRALPPPPREERGAWGGAGAGTEVSKPDPRYDTPFGRLPVLVFGSHLSLGTDLREINVYFS